MDALIIGLLTVGIREILFDRIRIKANNVKV
jgi:hypothetical protein